LWTAPTRSERVREIIVFFNYYNRKVDALGVEPEPDWDKESSTP